MSFQKKKHELEARLPKSAQVTFQNRPAPVYIGQCGNSTKTILGQFFRDVANYVQFDQNSILFAIFLFALVF